VRSLETRKRFVPGSQWPWGQVTLLGKARSSLITFEFSGKEKGRSVTNGSEKVFKQTETVIQVYNLSFLLLIELVMRLHCIFSDFST